MPPSMPRSSRSTWRAIQEPILACPNDPDDVKPLSEVAGDGYRRGVHRLLHDEHRPLPGREPDLRQGRLPRDPGLDDAADEDGCRPAYARRAITRSFPAPGSRMEIPGCSLCMGNQARVRPKATIISTSTRNFDDRMGDGARVYLGSAELAAVAALRGDCPRSTSISP